MKVFLATLFTFLNTFLICQAQLSEGGTPPGFALNQSRSTIPIETLPAINLRQLQEEDAQEATQGLPPRFGYAFDVSLNLQQSGRWIRLANGDRLWQLRLACPGAYSININYDDFYLPTGARFFIYNEQRDHVIGAFTRRNNKSHGGFASGLVYGDEIILEYLEPAAVQGQGRISLKQVVHGYRLIRLPGHSGRSFGDSGPCNVNVNCPGFKNDWKDQARSVALILVGGTRWCTGSLINNVRQDFTPYFLTANHCKGGQDALNNPIASSWSFYWRYESPVCANVDGPTTFSTSGATFIANDSPSDFALLELEESPAEAGYEIYFAGWNRGAILPSPSVGIHHPSGDIKKICQENQALVDEGTEWRVSDWDIGVTEPGSSGSPLFDANRRIVGQLFGGTAACAGSNDNNLPDYYGKLNYSWNNNGNPSPQRRLVDWLDPDNLGILALDGTYFEAELSFEQAGRSVREGEKLTGNTETCVPFRELTINLNLNRPASQTTLVNFASLGGTLTEGLDYAVPNNLVILKGSVGTIEFPIRIFDDAEAENEETLSLGFNLVTNGNVVLSDQNQSFNLVVLDNDEDPFVQADIPIQLAQNDVASTRPGVDSRQLGPGRSLYFYDRDSGHLMLGLHNPSTHDFGCVQVAVDRGGTDIQRFRNPNPSRYLIGKSYRLEVENPHPSQSVEWTVFYTEFELIEYEYYTGRSRKQLEAVWANASLGEVNPDNFFEFDIDTYPLNKLDYGNDQAYRFQAPLRNGGVSLGALDPEFPKELGDFTAQIFPAGIQLDWVMEAQIFNEFFTIERAPDDQNFTALGTLPGAGYTFDPQAYAYFDAEPLAGNNTYRLLKNRPDGSQKELGRINIGYQYLEGLRVFPNPFRDELGVAFFTLQTVPLRFELYAPTGQLLRREERVPEPGQNIVPWSLSDLPAGHYYVRVWQGAETSFATMVRKEN